VHHLGDFRRVIHRLRIRLVRRIGCRQNVEHIRPMIVQNNRQIAVRIQMSNLQNILLKMRRLMNKMKSPLVKKRIVMTNRLFGVRIFCLQVYNLQNVAERVSPACLLDACEMNLI